MSSALPLDVQNLFEDQIDSRIESAINRYDARSGEYPAVVTRKGSDGMWWCRVVGNEEETPIMTALTEMSIGDTIRLVIKDGRTTAQGNETAPAATSTSVSYTVQGSVAPLLDDLNELKIGKIDVREFNAEKAKINELMADKADITDLTAATARIDTLETNALTANSAVIQGMLVETAKVQNLTAIDLESAVGYIVDLTAEGIDVEALTADHAAVATLETDYAKIYNGVIVNANIDHANVNGLDAVYAQIDAANITEAAIKQTWADTIMVQTGLLAKEGAVYSLDAIEVNALNITAGTLDVERLVVNINGEKYLFDAKSVYNLTEDTTLYALSSGLYIYTSTSDTEVDSEKTYYTYDSETNQYAVVDVPVAEELAEYFERETPIFDPVKVYYLYDSVLDEYSVVSEPNEEDFATYYELTHPDKVYYTYDVVNDRYNIVAVPQESHLSEYYERTDASGYVKLDGDVLEERSIIGEKIIANSITAEEITTENLVGVGGWINLAEGTFRYVNAQTGSGIAWDGQYLTLFGGYTDETAIIHDIVGIEAWLERNTSPTTDTEVQDGAVYFKRVEGGQTEEYFLTSDEEIVPDKVYYSQEIGYAKTEDAAVNHDKEYYVLENDEYVLVSEPIDEDLGSYYEQTITYIAVEPEGSENPSTENWYEKKISSTSAVFSEIDRQKVSDTYSLTEDTDVDPEKTYYGLLMAYAQTQDTILDVSKVYYILQDGEYVVVQEPSEAELANYYELIAVYSQVFPEGAEDPSDEGWYEKGNPALQGLYVLDQSLYSFLESHLSDTGNGTVLKDGDSGYSLKVAQDGFYIYNNGGEIVGKYGENMQVGALSGTHMIADGDHLGFVTGDGQEVAYIDVDPNTKESVFYMTRSVVVKDMFFGEGLWKWYKRANNNMSLKWMGAS